MNPLPDKTENILGTLASSPKIPEVTNPSLPSQEKPVTTPIISTPENLTPSPSIPQEILEKEDVHVSSEKTIPKEKSSDSKLSQYLQVDRIYQEMLREENQEKIRLQLAIRYTLVMFAIFLVFAWIVSNRVIMFGFSEFMWLARIRDMLFAVMAGLFSLTMWFGSAVWMRRTFFIALLRTLSIVFFVAVISALYLPLF